MNLGGFGWIWVDLVVVDGGDQVGKYGSQAHIVVFVVDDRSFQTSFFSLFSSFVAYLFWFM